MAYGLQVFRSDGSLRLDISDRLTRTVNTVYISSPPYSPGFVAAPAGTASNFLAVGYMTYNNTTSPIQLTVVADGCYPYTGINATIPIVITFIGY